MNTWNPRVLSESTATPKLKSYTSEEVEFLVQKGIEFGETKARQAYENVKVITRIACIRWASGGFLAGAAFMALWLRFSQ